MYFIGIPTYLTNPEKDLGTDFRFRSMYRWVGGFQEFKIFEEYGDESKVCLQKDMKKDKIIELIKSDNNSFVKGLDPYLDSFFSWLQEFRNQYGDEEHFISRRAQI